MKNDELAVFEFRFTTKWIVSDGTEKESTGGGVVRLAPFIYTESQLYSVLAKDALDSIEKLALWPNGIDEYSLSIHDVCCKQSNGISTKDITKYLKIG